MARVYVGGLTEHLAELKENDLKEVTIMNKYNQAKNKFHFFKFI